MTYTPLIYLYLYDVTPEQSTACKDRFPDVLLPIGGFGTRCFSETMRGLHYVSLKINLFDWVCTLWPSDSVSLAPYSVTYLLTVLYDASRAVPLRLILSAWVRNFVNNYTKNQVAYCHYRRPVSVRVSVRAISEKLLTRN